MKTYIKGYVSNFRNPGVSFLAITDEKSVINALAKVNRFVKVVDSKIDRYSYIGPGSTIVGVNIGAFCSIACDVYIGLAGHTLDMLSTSPIFTETVNGTGHSWVKTSKYTHRNMRTHVGNDVWIGHGAKIMSGISIGDGAVVAAGAIVTHDVPPYAIVAGVPAKIIRYRFSEDIIERLLSYRWWSLPEAVLKTHIHAFQTREIDIRLINKDLPPPPV